MITNIIVASVSCPSVPQWKGGWEKCWKYLLDLALVVIVVDDLHSVYIYTPKL
jgi:hypothetical protein